MKKEIFEELHYIVDDLYHDFPWNYSEYFTKKDIKELRRLSKELSKYVNKIR